MTRLRTAPAARVDIREIRTYSKSAYGPRTAREYLDGLSAVFDLIAARPRIGGADEGLGPGIRSFRFRSHRIYYRLDGEDVLVVRVLHHARDTAEAVGSER